MPLKEVCQAIKTHNSFLITAHCDPEGDSIGSQLALADILRQLGKRYVIVNPDLPPERYRFLKGIKQIETPSKKSYKFDVALVLDCPIIERTGSVQKIISGKQIVNIDHHISNLNFGAINYVQPRASSAGEIIYELIQALGAKLNKDLAGYLYLAMLTDTGGFRYSNTTSKTMKIAGHLLEFGADPKDLYERMYESHSLASRKLLGLCLGTLKISEDGKLAWMHLTKAMFKKAGAASHDAENLINYARFIDGVKIAIFFSDAECSGCTKASFRSNANLDVNKIASKFGGGGHMSASGCVIKGGIKSVEKKVLKEARKALV